MELEGRWLILVVGLPGSGKSTVSSAVRQRVADCVEWDFDDAMPEEFKAKMRSGAVISAPERDHLIDVCLAFRSCREIIPSPLPYIYMYICSSARSDSKRWKQMLLNDLRLILDFERQMKR